MHATCQVLNHKSQMGEYSVRVQSKLVEGSTGCEERPRWLSDCQVPSGLVSPPAEYHGAASRAEPSPYHGYPCPIVGVNHQSAVPQNNQVKEYGYFPHTRSPEIVGTNLLNYSREKSIVQHSTNIHTSNFSPNNFTNNQALPFGSSNSSQMGYMYEPSSYLSSNTPPGRPDASRRLTSDHRAVSTWSVANQDQILPIGMGCTRRIIKSPIEKKLSYTSLDSRADRMITKNNIYLDSHEHKNGQKRTDNVLISESTSSLDFLAEGERMVSLLCNISAESRNEKLKCNPKLRSDENIGSRKIQKPESSIDVSSINLEGVLIDDISTQIVKLAVEACTDAENIAVAHHNRPCFKNIHSICAKTRSNVQKPDSAVANLHSQGIPWVIKNFIFSFVRILDGWKGVKELMSEKHDSFSRIEKKYYSPNIRECFFQWQAVTKDMLEHMYKTFKCLDEGFTTEQKSFTHNYYANPTAPRYQNQNKSQQTKNMATINRPTQITSQQNLNTGHWPPPPVQPTTEAQWAMNSANVSRKMTNILTTNSGLPYQIADQTDVNDQHLSKLPKQLPMTNIRETKIRQPYTMPNIPVNRLPFENLYPCEMQNGREPQYQMRSKSIAELRNATSSQSMTNITQEYLHLRNSITGDNPVRKEGNETVDKQMLIPLSQVERNIQLASSSAFEMNSWFEQKNSTVENRKEYDVFGNWAQINMKDINEYIGNPNNSQGNQGTQAPPVGESTPLQHLEPDTDEFHDLSKVYMKPGSYKVPTKPPDISTMHFNPNMMQVNTLDGIEYSGLDSSPSNVKIPFPAAPIVPPPRYALESSPYHLSKKQASLFYENMNKMNLHPCVPQIDIDDVINDNVDGLNSAYSDRAWEAAKQSAPQLLDSIHEGSKSDTDRLYDALGLRSISSLLEEQSLQLNAHSNKNDSWLINLTPLVNKRRSDIWNQKECNLTDSETGDMEMAAKTFRNNELKPSTDSIDGNNDKTENKNNFDMHKVQCQKKFLPSSNTNEKCIKVSEWQSLPQELDDGRRKAESLTVKKSKYKARNAQGGGAWYYTKKQKALSSASGKKIENILEALWNMEEGFLIQYEMDHKLAPNFYDVVKYPISLSEISHKLKSNIYVNLDQVIHDFRGIFYNARLYLKSYPDSTMKRKINKLSAEFEKLFADEFQKWDIRHLKGARQERCGDKERREGNAQMDYSQDKKVYDKEEISVKANVVTNVTKKERDERDATKDFDNMKINGNN